MTALFKLIGKRTWRKSRPFLEEQVKKLDLGRGCAYHVIFPSTNCTSLMPKSLKMRFLRWLKCNQISNNRSNKSCQAFQNNCSSTRQPNHSRLNPTLRQERQMTKLCKLTSLFSQARTNKPICPKRSKSGQQFTSRSRIWQNCAERTCLAKTQIKRNQH